MFFGQDCLVPHGYSEDPSFAEWIHRQRTTYAMMLKQSNPNLMVKERMEKLLKIGFNFTVHSDKWLDHYKMLEAYKMKHNHCRVPTHFAENPKLGRWVHTQRHQRRLQSKEKKSCMTQERINLLDKLGFLWEVRPSLERPRATWQQRFEELKQFYSIHNHFLIRGSEDSHLSSLNTWCHEQKSRLKKLEKNNGKDWSRRMGPERVKELVSIGFTKDVELVPMPFNLTEPPSIATVDAPMTATVLEPTEKLQAEQQTAKNLGDGDNIKAQASEIVTMNSLKEEVMVGNIAR